MARCVDVLVVDVHTVDADMTTLAIRLAAPHARVLRLRDGAEALEYLFAVGRFAGRSPSLPHLVFLDTEMPAISGSCVLDIIRAHPLTHRLAVVMFSSNPDSRARRRADLFAADAYVVKPVDFDRYCALVDALLSRWLPQAPFAAARARLKRRNLHRSLQAYAAARSILSI